MYITDTSPPKKVLDDAATTLIQAQLVPMSIVYVHIDSSTGKLSL